jgi:hypothetical protein
MRIRFRIRIPNSCWKFQEEACRSCDAGGWGGGVIWTTEAEGLRGLTLMSVLPRIAGGDRGGRCHLYCVLLSWKCISSQLLLRATCQFQLLVYKVFAFNQNVTIQTRMACRAVLPGTCPCPLKMTRGSRICAILRFTEVP